MPVKFSYGRNELIAEVSGELDHHAASEIRIMTDGELERSMPAVLTFDMSGVSFMDSSGIGLILGRARTMQSWGGKIRVSKPSERALKILKLSGLEKLIVRERKEGAKDA